MSEDGYSQGGYIKSGAVKIRVSVAGTCTCGRLAYRLGDDQVLEHIIPGDLIGKNDMTEAASYLHYPRLVDPA